MSFTQTKPDQLFPFLTIPADLGVFTASQFFTWRRYLYAEHRCLYKEIAHKHKRLHNFDRQINQCKQTKDHRQMGELIEKRKKVHDELKDLDWQIYACNK
jgi:hypothetical protein